MCMTIQYALLQQASQPGAPISDDDGARGTTSTDPVPAPPAAPAIDEAAPPATRPPLVDSDSHAPAVDDVLCPV